MHLVVRSSKTITVMIKHFRQMTPIAIEHLYCAYLVTCHSLYGFNYSTIYDTATLAARMVQF